MLARYRAYVPSCACSSLPLAGCSQSYLLQIKLSCAHLDQGTETQQACQHKLPLESSQAQALPPFPRTFPWVPPRADWGSAQASDQLVQQQGACMAKQALASQPCHGFFPVWFSDARDACKLW